MISIIVPVYNSEKWLSRCIESILSQSNPNWELLLINDGSTDKSGNICDEYSKNDSRILVFHKNNSGVSSARNVGLDNANGDWITFCDSDDELSPNTIELYSGNISNDIDVIRGGFERIKDAKTSVITIPNLVLDNKEQVLSVCSQSGYEAYLWNSCFRKSTINSIRFDDTISWCEDHLFTFQVINNANKVQFISDIVYRYYAPSCLVNSFGSHLSTKYIDPEMIIKEATKEREIKKSFLPKNSTEGYRIVNDEYKYKVNLAIRYAILGKKYKKAITIAAQNGFYGIRKLFNIYLHTIITAKLKKIIKLNPQ